MILDIVNKSMKYIIIIALISLVSTWAFGIYNNMIQETTINGITIKTFDIRIYLNNVSNAWNTAALDFETILPDREWDDTAAWNNWDGLFNNIALLFDYLYLPINFVLYILRWIAWILRLALAIIGWNISTDGNGVYFSNLAYILTWITQNLMIPYL